MDWQIAFNVLASVACTVCGWVLNTLWNAVESLRSDIAKLEALSAEKYVRRADFERHTDRVERKLDQIYEALQSKADKS